MPFFYGHSGDRSKPAGNVWSHQGRRAAAIFSTLDEAQRGRALVDAGVPSNPLAAGIAVGSLDGSQKQMVRRLLRDLTRPFRAFEVDEVRRCLDGPEGVDALRLTFFKAGKPGDDRPGDLWKLESPTFTWSFHGSPHVHSWVVLSPRSMDLRVT